MVINPCLRLFGGSVARRYEFPKAILLNGFHEHWSYFAETMSMLRTRSKLWCALHSACLCSWLHKGNILTMDMRRLVLCCVSLVYWRVFARGKPAIWCEVKLIVSSNLQGTTLWITRACANQTIIPISNKKTSIEVEYFWKVEGKIVSTLF